MTARQGTETGLEIVTHDTFVGGHVGQMVCPLVVFWIDGCTTPRRYFHERSHLFVRIETHRPGDLHVHEERCPGRLMSHEGIGDD